MPSSNYRPTRAHAQGNNIPLPRYPPATFLPGGTQATTSHPPNSAANSNGHAFQGYASPSQTPQQPQSSATSQATSDQGAHYTDCQFSGSRTSQSPEAQASQATQPLPWWSKWSQIVPKLFRPLVLLQIIRTLFHLVPAVFVYLIFDINNRHGGRYIGSHLPGIPALLQLILKPYEPFPFWDANDVEDFVQIETLQWISKVVEIAILATLGSIIWDVVHLLLGHTSSGIPLGLLSWGHGFSQIDFLVSRDFWGACRSSLNTLCIVLVVFSGFLFAFIANTIGPATAVLMIPTNQTWDTAYYDFDLNGTAADLWPATFTDRHVGGTDCFHFEGAMANPGCNAGGFPSLRQYFSSFRRFPQGMAFQFDTEDHISRRSYQGFIRNGWSNGSETWTRAPHAATVTMEDVICGEWNLYLRRINDTDNKNGRLTLSNFRTSTVKSEIPVVRVACVSTPNISITNDNLQGTVSLPFPVLPEYDFWYIPSSGGDPDNGFYGDGPVAMWDVEKSLLVNTNATESTPSDTPSSHLHKLYIHTNWVPLGNDDSRFGSTSAGAIVVISSSSPSKMNTTIDMAFTCSIDSRWALGENWLRAAESDWSYAGYTWPMQTSLEGERPPNSDRSHSLKHFRPAPDGGWRRAALSPSWLSALSPIVPGRNTSTLAVLLEDGLPNLMESTQPLATFAEPNSLQIHSFTEHVLSSAVTDGMARAWSGYQPNISIVWRIIGEYRADTVALGGEAGVQVRLNPDFWPERTKMTMHTSVEGYVYRLDGSTAQFSAAVLLIYFGVICIHLLIFIPVRLWIRTWNPWNWTDVSRVVELARHARVNPTTTDKAVKARDMARVIDGRLEIDKGHSLANIGNSASS